jgi:hypothetical protein
MPLITPAVAAPPGSRSSRPHHGRSADPIDCFIQNTFDYPALAEAYKIAGLDAWIGWRGSSRLSFPDARGANLRCAIAHREISNFSDVQLPIRALRVLFWKAGTRINPIFLNIYASPSVEVRCVDATGSSEPVSDARCDSSIQLPSGSRTIEIRAVVPSVTGARASRPP